MIEWESSDALLQTFHGPFKGVRVASDQAAVFMDGGTVIATLRVGEYSVESVDAPPFLRKLSAKAQVSMLRISPMWGRFGSAGVQVPVGGNMVKLRHFGEWQYQVLDPARFAEASLETDVLAAAAQRVGDLFDACALEWINGGHMTALDLAANHEQFRQVLPAHIDTAIGPWGLRVVSLADFVANMDI